MNSWLSNHQTFSSQPFLIAGDEGEESALSAAMKRQRLTRRVSQRQMLERANPGAFSIEAKAQQDLKLM